MKTREELAEYIRNRIEAQDRRDREKMQAEIKRRILSAGVLDDAQACAKIVNDVTESWPVNPLLKEYRRRIAKS